MIYCYVSESFSPYINKCSFICLPMLDYYITGMVFARFFSKSKHFLTFVLQLKLKIYGINILVGLICQRTS